MTSESLRSIGAIESRGSVGIAGWTTLTLHALLWYFLTLLAARLYEIWFERKIAMPTSEPERMKLERWLTPSRAALCLAVAVCAQFGYGFPFVLAFGLSLLALAAHPLLSFAALADSSGSAAPPADESLSSQRERILKLLEDGKISAHECQELLQALGETAALDFTSKAAGASAAQRLLFVGAGIIAIGFFLPWLSVNLAQELDRSMGQIGKLAELGAQFHFTGNVPIQGGMLPQDAMDGLRRSAAQMGTVQVKAGDLPHGIGWWILLLGLAGAVLPWALSEMNLNSRQRLGLILLGAGGVLTVYEMIDAYRFLNVGPFVSLAGSMLSFGSALRESGVLSPPAPAAAAVAVNRAS